MSTKHETVNAKVDAARAALDPELKAKVAAKYGEAAQGVTSLSTAARLVADEQGGQNPHQAAKLDRYANAVEAVQQSISGQNND
ncbi:hypothetical protein KBC79_06090 [Candidatus Woesebacteria bacterium]|nr:hypothetical protein [Candidatus Woesebacteria bacterium]